LHLVDIDAADFDASAWSISRRQLMQEIHARTADGHWITGPEVFRQVYATLGYGWLLAPTRWPLIGPITNRVYRWFAKLRLAWADRRGRVAT
jgi:predicted DCC family thiol-disulfide oxidoreductase YuxK